MSGSGRKRGPCYAGNGKYLSLTKKEMLNLGLKVGYIALTEAKNKQGETK